jgi:hypothetical protein
MISHNDSKLTRHSVFLFTKPSQKIKKSQTKQLLLQKRLIKDSKARQLGSGSAEESVQDESSLFFRVSC